MPLRISIYFVNGRGYQRRRKIGLFLDGLNYQLKIEILEENCETFEGCACMALFVDSAIWRAKKGSMRLYPGHKEHSWPTKMETGNISGVTSNAQREQQKRI